MGGRPLVPHQRTCPICGKKFYPAPEHVWTVKRSPILVCSYSCHIKSFDAPGRTLSHRERKAYETQQIN